MSIWYTENTVIFIEHLSRFEGMVDLLGKDGVHSSWVGTALISCSIAHSLDNL